MKYFITILVVVFVAMPAFIVGYIFEAAIAGFKSGQGQVLQDIDDAHLKLRELLQRKINHE